MASAPLPRGFTVDVNSSSDFARQLDSSSNAHVECRCSWRSALVALHETGSKSVELENGLRSAGYGSLPDAGAYGDSAVILGRSSCLGITIRSIQPSQLSSIPLMGSS